MGQRRNQKRKFFLNIEENEYGNTMYQNLWDAAKAVPRGEFTMIKTYITKRSESNSWSVVPGSL